jgi:autotransporter-associated beta strand protein
MSASNYDLTVNSGYNQHWGNVAWNVGAGRTLTVNGGITGAPWGGGYNVQGYSDIVKDGAGTAVVTAATSYIANIIVNGGTLQTPSAVPPSRRRKSPLSGTNPPVEIFMRISIKEPAVPACHGCGAQSIPMATKTQCSAHPMPKRATARRLLHTATTPISSGWTNLQRKPPSSAWPNLYPKTLPNPKH